MGFPFFKLVFGSAALIIAYYTDLYEEIYRNNVFPIKPHDFLLPIIKQYDFIIVGSGSAGAVVANRLSKKFSVLLLDAGGDPPPQYEIPAFAKFIHSSDDERQFYIFTSIPQANSSLSTGGIYRMAQGRGLGGSSSINSMIYNRGNPYDFDNWANLTGDPSWNYQNLLKYFQMSENCYSNCNAHLGSVGPMGISKVESVLNKEELQWVSNWHAAGTELGFPSDVDTNSPQVTGFGNIWKTVKLGKRQSTFAAFIEPIRNRANLAISRYSIATKIEIEVDKAVGVFYTRHGHNFYATASKEIIVSAGAINGPHLLMKSGIGPAEDLQHANIDVKANLLVGGFYQCHPRIILDNIKLQNPLNQNMTQAHIDDYAKNGKGPLANAYENFAQAFLVSSEQKKEFLDWPDIQFDYGFNSSTINDGGDNLYICAVLGRPTSSGTLKLNVENPEELIWDPNFLANERDVKVLTEAAKIAAAVAETNVFKNGRAILDKTPLPECTDFEYGLDEYWECVIRQKTLHTFHPSGTCKMGKIEDPSSVVDTQLRVIGIKSLRVIDNSIQPMITNANTNAVAIMIGQKGADLLLTTWQSDGKENEDKDEEASAMKIGLSILLTLFICFFNLLFTPA